MKFKKVSLHFSKQIHIFFETGGFFIWKKTGVCHSESFKSAFVSTKMGDVNYFLEKKVEWKQEVQQNFIYLLRQNCWVQSYLKWQSKLEDV